MKKWEKLKRGVEKRHVFQFRMTMQNFRTVMRNETEWALVVAHQGKSEN